jgi:hypothetical protein
MKIHALLLGVFPSDEEELLNIMAVLPTCEFASERLSYIDTP